MLINDSMLYCMFDNYITVYCHKEIKLPKLHVNVQQV